MYSSYGSYSSMSSLTQPLSIGPSSYLSNSSTYHANCAFPSWPQRPSLGDRERRASAYLSDDDLLDFEDDAHSVSSAGSHASGSPFVTEQELLEMRQREQQAAAMEREALRIVMFEKKRRKQQAARRQRRSSGGSSSGSAKKSPKNKGDAMAPISEAVE